MPNVHLTTGPIKELRAAIRALDQAIEAEYKIYGFGGFLAEFEVCQKELGGTLVKMQEREERNRKKEKKTG